MKIAEMEVSEFSPPMGTDLTVVNAARVSFHKESAEFSASDEKLINYLAKHGHWTPFAHCFASFRIKAPIFVARQLVKHQVGLAWNEVSRRYVDEEPECYLPSQLRARPDSSIKQGSSKESIAGEEGWLIGLEMQCELAFDYYKKLIKASVAPEQARMVLPQNTMTEWIWSGSLAAFARVCKLRLDEHAQQETREVAAMIANYCEKYWPVSFNALLEN